jgi:hypothetical protein
MANLEIGTKAIVKDLKGAVAGGFNVGETVIVKRNPIATSREKGRICVRHLDSDTNGYFDRESLLPVNNIEKVADSVVKLEIEGTKFEGTVVDVLALVKGLQELATVKPATFGELAEAEREGKLELAKAEPVPTRLQDEIGVGTKIKITDNRRHGEVNLHGFDIGEVVTVMEYQLRDVNEEQFLRATNGRTNFTVHASDFKVHYEVTPSVGMLAYVKDGKGEQGCLYGYNDGQLVEIVSIDSSDYKPIKVKKANGEDPIGYADINDLELLF